MAGTSEAVQAGLVAAQDEIFSAVAVVGSVAVALRDGGSRELETYLSTSFDDRMAC